jgi:hypothetical protein
LPDEPLARKSVKPTRQRDEGFPNIPEGNPNFSERYPSRVEQITNPAERNQNSLSLFFKGLSKGSLITTTHFDGQHPQGLTRIP